MHELRFLSAFLMIVITTSADATDPPAGDDPTGSDAPLVEVTIPSSIDGTDQPALWWAPRSPKELGNEDNGAPDEVGEGVPLLVHLHTWSGGYRQASPRDSFWALARQRGWAFIHPHFRGPNQTPEACGSALAMADVVDAVRFAQANADIDASRIYLVGSSGGGHMALQTAAHHPELWAGVSAWVPISDLFAWHATHTKIEDDQPKPGRYARMIEASCGGPPGTPATDREYVARSPLFHLHRAAGLPIDINVGIHDGHKGSVPTDQSLLAFNVLAEANGDPGAAFTAEEVALIRDERRTPARDSLTDGGAPAIEQPRRFEVLLRRTAGPARITVFDGGHTHDEQPAVAWLTDQQRTDRP